MEPVMAWSQCPGGKCRHVIQFNLEKLGCSRPFSFISFPSTYWAHSLCFLVSPPCGGGGSFQPLPRSRPHTAFLSGTILAVKSILSLSRGRALLRSGMDSQQRSLQSLTQAKPLSDKSRAGLRDTNSPEVPVVFLASDPTCCIALSLPVAHAPPGCCAMCPCHPLLCFSEPLHHCQLIAAGMETAAPGFPRFSVALVPVG